MTSGTIAPVALGGIGGSGTRLGAALLRALGFWIGSDLNGPLDNLWFTLLFKRRPVLLETQAQFQDLHALFIARMQGTLAPTARQRQQLLELASADRYQHTKEWLAERTNTFLADENPSEPRRKIAWKEPNTHIVIDRLFDADPTLRYIHFLRHPLYMAYSSNQAQLHNWGPVLLNRDVALGPADSLTYWCAAHKRIAAYAQIRPDRILFVDYDALVAEPKQESGKIMHFLGEERINLAAIDDFLEHRPNVPRPAIRLADFRADDLHYVAAIGYKPA